MKVFINPGHAPNGNPDPGAVNKYNGLRESDVAKAVADLLEGYLVNAGVEVVGNLQSDDLAEVVSASDNADADVFVSIHCNSAVNETAEGTETFYFYTSANGERLARCIQKQIAESVCTYNRGVKASQPGRNGLYVLTNTNAVAVLVELAFISNAEDVILLQDNQDDFARAIARGVTDYQQG